MYRGLCQTSTDGINLVAMLPRFRVRDMPWVRTRRNGRVDTSRGSGNLAQQIVSIPIPNLNGSLLVTQINVMAGIWPGRNPEGVQVLHHQIIFDRDIHVELGNSSKGAAEE